MSISSLKNRFAASNLAYKLVIVGSLFAAIGCLFPWYKEVNSRDIVTSYLGITGPLYLIGYSILAISGLVLAQGCMSLWNKRPYTFLGTSPSWQLGGIVQSAFLLILATSIFFDVDFGTGFVTVKTPLYGMFMVGFGIITSGIGAGMMVRNEAWFTTLFPARKQKAAAPAPTRAEPAPVPRAHQPVSVDAEPTSQQETPHYRIQKTQHGIVTKVETVFDRAKKPMVPHNSPDISENFNQQS